MIKIVSNPTWGIQTQAFYDEEVDLVFVKVIPERKPAKSLVSRNSRLALGITDERLLESVEFLGRKDEWRTEHDFVLPTENISYGDITFKESVKTPLADPVPECDPDGIHLRLRFPGLNSKRHVAVGDSLLFSLDEKDDLCAIWTTNIYIDFGCRKRRFLSFLREKDSLRPETS